MIRKKPYAQKVTVWIKTGETEVVASGGYTYIADTWDKQVVKCRFYDETKKTKDAFGEEVMSDSRFEAEYRLELKGEVILVDEGEIIDTKPTARAMSPIRIFECGSPRPYQNPTSWTWYLKRGGGN
jgi:uncharacterized protein YodC (DUF2158 family)